MMTKTTTKAIAVALLIGLWVSVCAFSFQIGGSYDFKYVVLDLDGAFVSSETPTLTILKPPDPTYYNFSTTAWDVSESGNTSQSLAEITGLFYHYEWTPPGADTTPETYGFLVRNTGTYADIQIEEVNYESIEETIDRIEIDTTAIEADTTSIETKVDAIKTVVDSIQIDTDALEGVTLATFTVAAANSVYLVEVQGATFNEATDSLEAIRDRGDAAWLSSTGDSFVGTGDTAVDEDYGGTEALAYTYSGAGIDNATITAFLKADYDVKNWGAVYMKGVTKTNTVGFFEVDLQLDCGFTYTIVYYKQGQYGPDTQEVTVTCP
jgi:hypothetical protein